MISVALLILPGLGLALSECKQRRSSGAIKGVRWVFKRAEVTSRQTSFFYGWWWGRGEIERISGHSFIPAKEIYTEAGKSCQ